MLFRSMDGDEEQVTDVLDRALRTVQGLDKSPKDLTEIDEQLRTLLGPAGKQDAAAKTDVTDTDTDTTRTGSAATSDAARSDAATKEAGR